VLLGLFGGTFDPIHNGHIQAANSAYQTLELDKVIMIPAGDPYLKRTNLTASKSDRYEMVSLAIEEFPFLEVSDIEILRPGPSYTVDSVKHFKKDGHAVVVLLGIDSIIDMDNWTYANALHSECEVIGLTRPGIKIDSSEAYLKRQKRYSIRTIDANSSLISSSEIRKLIQKGADVKDMVPQSVYEYILKKKLYHSLI
tara:strand:+ start:30 stop:623 length:594 start_codon:yes stop_codon:yes gene_type:complete